MVARFSGQGHQRGSAYLWALLIVLLISLGMGHLLQHAATANQRMREADLLYVGNLYRNAIRQYFESTPAGTTPYPQRLEDLLRDPRYPVTRRYLRRLYPDPVSGERFQVVLAPGGEIMGVRSVSTRAPVKNARFGVDEKGFENAKSYHEWQFSFAL